MKGVNPRGFGLIGIVLVVGVVAVGIGVYASLSSTTAPVAVSEEFEADPTALGIENVPQNMVENATNDVMEAVDGRDEMMEDEMGTESDMVNEDTVESDMAMDDKMEDEMPSEAPLVVAAGTFEAYSAEKLALAENGTVVLFFHADWCPSCRGLENDINGQLSQIPAKTHILKLDYDTETELKKQYGVIRQHTLVVVDANGTELKKLTGLTNTLDQVVNQL